MSESKIKRQQLYTLMKACIKSDLEVVKLLLDKLHVDSQDASGWTALMMASQKGCIDVVKFLLERNAKVDIVQNNGCTALMLACEGGHVDVVKLLIDKGAQIDVTDKDGLNPLIIAGQHGHIDLIKFLLDEGAQINFQSTVDGTTALMKASEHGYTDAVKFFLDKGAEVDLQGTDGFTALMSASAYGHNDVVKLLLDKGATVDNRSKVGITALMVASAKGHENCVKTLIEHGADIYNELENEPGQYVSALTLTDNADIIRLLLGSESESKTKDVDTNTEDELDSEKGKISETEAEYKEYFGNQLDSEESDMEVKSKEPYSDIPSDSEESKTSESEAESEILISGRKLLAAIEMAIKDGENIDNMLVHGVFLGPPRSGKDSLMKRLMGEMPSDISPSTGAAEKVVYVRMEKSMTFAATIEDSNWIRLKFDEEALQIMKTAFSKNLNVAERESNTDKKEPDHKTDPSMLDKVSSKTEQYDEKLKDFHASVYLEEQCNLSQSASTTTSSKPKMVPGIIIPQSEYYKPPMEFFKEAIRNKDIEGLKKCLANTQSLYLTNTGGQMEFQELLPLLVSGPSVFFITFQLHRSITDTYSVVYQLPSGELSNSYQSSLSVMETILQTLSSISAMGTYVYKGIQKKTVPLRPKVFIIGTHKDLLEKRSANANIESIDKCLQAVIKSTSHYREGIIQFASESQMIFTVNNHDPDDSDFRRIRATFEKVVEKGDYRMMSPARWMIYSLVVRQLQNPIQSYDECYAIAKECGIRDKNELDEALHFIHTKMGLIRYFPYKELADIVIIDPQILFEKITELIVESFTFENVGKHAMETFKNKGIFSLSDFERISSQTSRSLTPKLFAQLLEHLRIAAPLNQDGVMKYFVPCALAHAEKKETASLLSTLPPLLVIFQCGYCPKGIFGTLITYLITNEMQSSFEWEIISERIYRDEATFQVGPYDIITIRFLLTHLEITLTESNSDLPREHCTVEEVCQEVHSSINKGIKTVTSAINYINAKHLFTFYCTSENCKSISHPAKLNKIRDKLCNLSCGKMCFPLPLGYEKWQLDSTEICYDLKKCHYPLLMNQLTKYAAKWREIGTHLEFQQEELDIIEARPLLLSGAPKTWLSTLISEWIERAPGDSRGSTKCANLKDLKSAVSKAGLGAVAAGLSLKQKITTETGQSN